MAIEHSRLVEELAEYFLSQKYIVHGAIGLHGYQPPPSIPNDGFGDMEKRIPDVVGLDRVNQRIVFGVVRGTGEELDSERSLTDYNVFLDHRQAAGIHASQLVILLPASLVTELNTILTHYVHREYWHRILVIPSRLAE